MPEQPCPPSLSWRRGLLALVATLALPLLCAPFLSEVTGKELTSVVTRMLSVGAMLSLLAARGLPRWHEVRAVLGPRPLSSFAWGYLATLAVMISLAAALFAVGVLVPRTEPADDTLRKIAQYLVAGVLIGITEEAVFRAFLLQRMRRVLGTLVGVLVTSALYAWVHCARLSAEGAVDPSIGGVAQVYLTIVRQLVEQPFAEPRPLLGLFLFGVLLAAVVLRTGRLAPAIGIHAAAVFFLKTDGKLVWCVQSKTNAWTGGVRYYDGAVCWLLLVALTMLVVWWPRSRKTSAA